MKCHHVPLFVTLRYPATPWSVLTESLQSLLS